MKPISPNKYMLSSLQLCLSERKVKEKKYDFIPEWIIIIFISALLYFLKISLLYKFPPPPPLHTHFIMLAYFLEVFTQCTSLTGRCSYAYKDQGEKASLLIFLSCTPPQPHFLVKLCPSGRSAPLLTLSLFFLGGGPARSSGVHI